MANEINISNYNEYSVYCVDYMKEAGQGFKAAFFTEKSEAKAFKDKLERDKYFCVSLNIWSWRMFIEK